MQERNARPYQVGTSTSNTVEKPESEGERPSQSEVVAESAQNVERWSDGFVKPDGTRIQLFVPRAAAA